MSLLSLVLPTIGSASATEDPKTDTAFLQIQTVINGNLDSGNLSPATAASLGLNGVGGTYKGSVEVAKVDAAISTEFTGFGDEIANVSLPAAGLLLIYFRAMVSASPGALKAAIFLNGIQVQAPGGSASTATSGANVATELLYTGASGLALAGVSSNSALASTGQILPAPTVVAAAAGTYTVAIKYAVSAPGTTGSLAFRRLVVESRAFS